MDVDKMKHKLDEYCEQRLCNQCKIDRLMPNHSCGYGTTFMMDDYPLEELRREYTIVYRPAEHLIRYWLERYSDNEV